MENTKYIVIINDTAYENEVPLQSAFDFIIYRSKQYQRVEKDFSASIMDNETGELVYVTDHYIS